MIEQPPTEQASSLPVIYDLTRERMGEQMSSFNLIDQKAALLLLLGTLLLIPISILLVSFPALGEPIWLTGLLFVLICADYGFLLQSGSIGVRTHQLHYSPDAVYLFQSYLTRPPQETQYQVIQSSLECLQENEGIKTGKIRAIKDTWIALFVEVALLAAVMGAYLIR